MDTDQTVRLKRTPVGAGNPSAVATPTPPPPANATLNAAAPAALLGGYQLVRVIATGGMGTVYEAIQLNLSRTVALKLLNPELASRPEFVQRFQREAKAAAALNHPNIVQVHDFGQDGASCYLVMEYLEGKDLEQIIQEQGPFAPGAALSVIEEAAVALKAACEKAIIHRDIKPSNLMLTREGRLKVSDLGLAKIMTEASDLTLTGVGIGSPYYMAPEQASDARDVDHRADIYSLGVTLVFLLTGRRPFQGATPFSVVLAHASKPLPTGAELGRPLPDEVEVLIQKMTAKDPLERHPDYDSLLEDLRRVRAGQRPAFDFTSAKRKFLSRAAVPVTVTLALVAIALLMVALRLRTRTSGQKVVPAAASASLASDTSRPAAPNPPRPHRRRGDRSERPLTALAEQSPGPERFADGPLLPDEGELEGPDMASGPGPDENAGPFPLPLLPRPNMNPLKEAPVEVMLAEADAFAKRTPQNFHGIVERYRQVLTKARGTPQEADVAEKLKKAGEEHQTAIHALLRDYRKRMDEKLKEGNLKEAWSVWKDFPATLRTPASDRVIRQVLAKSFPPDFKPE